jgi:ankyrin repeat protein
VLSWAAENGHEVTFERLIEKGADFESKDNYSRTVLHWASLGGKEAVVRMLLEIGADFNSRNDDGESPLYWAAHYGNEAVVRMLLEIGADFNSRNDDGESPLHCAARDGNEAIVRMLLELGADFESKTEDRESPLHYAAESGSEAAVRMLLEIGADDQVRDNAGHTPLSLATERGHEVIIQLLQQHADSPASRQSSEAYHSVPYNAWDITAGISSAEIDLNSVPTLYKKVGQDWHALFDPQLQRDLDVDLVHVLEHSFPVTSVRFSHDGMHIATSSHRTARIFDIQTGEQVRVLDHNIPHTDQSIYISSVSFSPDDHYLATGGDNGMVCVSQFPACIQLQLN